MTPVDAARLELKVSDAVILAYMWTCSAQLGVQLPNGSGCVSTTGLIFHLA